MHRNLSLEQFYRRISKKILLVEAYLENKYIVSLIKGCRLKPITVFSNQLDPNTTLETIWADEFNNTLTIKKKKIKINLNVDKIQHITTDIFRNETIEFFIKHSGSACIGMYPNSDDFIVIFKSTDNYLRCFKYINKQISISSPLIAGYQILKYCVKPKNKQFYKLKTRSEIKEMKQIEWFVTKLPAQQLLLSNIKMCDKLRSVLYNGQ